MDREAWGLGELLSGSANGDTPGIDSKAPDYDAGRDWGQEEKGTTEDEMAEWHH